MATTNNGFLLLDWPVYGSWVIPTDFTEAFLFRIFDVNHGIFVGKRPLKFILYDIMCNRRTMYSKISVRISSRVSKESSRRATKIADTSLMSFKMSPDFLWKII